jgi:hypothetical protein
MKFPILLFLFFVLVLSFLIPYLVQAGLVPCGCVGYDEEGNCCGSIRITADGKIECESKGEPCQLCHLFVLFDRIVDFLLLNIVPPLAILMVVIAGTMYILAYLEVIGNPNWIVQAKSLIYSVLIGVIIIYGAWLLVNFFLQIIGVESWTGLEKGWWEIKCP